MLGKCVVLLRGGHCPRMSWDFVKKIINCQMSNFRMLSFLH